MISAGCVASGDELFLEDVLVAMEVLMETGRAVAFRRMVPAPQEAVLRMVLNQLL